jgi:phosphoribosylaminoimidazolecarboxamide formyltransferase/IMP cyclohydrolase
MSKTAIVSVSDKTDITLLGNFLKENEYTILSTGGTAKALREAGIQVTEISDYTGMPEILDGRVKTLHPKIYGGILNRSDDLSHQEEIAQHSIVNIDLVAVNLYPFESKPSIENIDIGGVTLIRAAAKNYQDVFVLTAPKQYQEFITNTIIKKTTQELAEYRRRLATEAFRVTSQYDTLINQWFSGSTSVITKQKKSDSDIPSGYNKFIDLKYGCNPHQTEAALYVKNGDQYPFEVLNGSLGYINTLDALNSWRLVTDIKSSLDIPAATSFKHVSPAGVGLGIEIKSSEAEFLGVSEEKLAEYSPIALAYLRARNCDPKSSFGDFIAVNERVDVTLARIIKSCVTDGIIAPSYDLEAMEILEAKKGGKFVILQGNIDCLSTPQAVEWKSYSGILMKQTANNHVYTEEDFSNIVTKNSDLSEETKRDMIMSMITMKYTQSNSVGYAYNGQMIGIGAGQQSRIDCTILARRKAEVWLLRHHPEVYKFAAELPPKMKKQDKVNSIIYKIEEGEDFIPDSQQKQFFENFRQHNNINQHLILTSDGFFPFGDSINEASKIHVSHVVQPGGSIADETVIAACNSLNICMVTTGIRAFHH